ncbi:protein DpdE [Vibrio diabolicus]
MSSVRVGSLVKSHSAFNGIGKVVAINTVLQTADIAFFHSPKKPYEGKITVKATELQTASIQLQSIVFCRIGSKQRWQQGFYDGARPNDQFLIKFSRSYSDVFDVRDLFVPNLPSALTMQPQDFLKAKCTVSPYLTEMRNRFFDAYIDQRSACESIPALLGSAVELESHQLAVVSRVLSDSTQKYLLCDEVGLGKTIEAGLILRHHINEKGRQARVFIIAPQALIGQWKKELETRFHLGDILDLASDSLGDNFDPEQIIFIGEYQEILDLNKQFAKLDGLKNQPQVPTMIVIDEAHHLSEFAWSENDDERTIFNNLAGASDLAECSLLLTGTPLVGRERDYLAMLHCLEPGKYPLTEQGVEQLTANITNQSNYVALYRSLDPSHEDDDIEDAIEAIEALVLQDNELDKYIEEVKPLVDFYNDDEVDPVIRNTAVLALRKYFGERYTTNYRMLRNRRSSSNGALQCNSIGHLFPGLSPSQVITWNLPLSQVLLDQQLDDLRAMQSVLKSSLLSEHNYLSWVNALMLSPEFFAKKIKSEADLQLTSSEERERWMSMLDVAKAEQRAKDKALQDAIIEWKEEHPSGKVVVFCGEPSVADSVYKVLDKLFGCSAERHVPGIEPAFVQQDSVSVLVCDQHGEDGLNLQGKKRLAIHYSLPLEVHRIEQRNGRLNRYSAQNRGASPVQNMIMLPAREGFYRGWADVLRYGIGTFEEYRASIQEPIDQFLQASWPRVWSHGYEQLKEMETELSRANGIVRTELRKLELQDTMDRDTLDVRESVRFAERIKNADERFDESSTHYLNWITNGLMFNRSRGGVPDSFTLSFQHERTRVNVNNLIKHCVIGLDFDNSSYITPKTHPMSLERSRCAQTGAYPFRLGQPFVDAIYMLSSELPYGVTSALIRKVSAKIQRQLVIKTQWLSTYDDGSSSNQILKDRVAAPMICHYAHQSNGTLISTSPNIELLNAPYSKAGSNLLIGEIAIPYQDHNISMMQTGKDVTDLWEYVEQFYTQTTWEHAIDEVFGTSQQQQHTEYMKKNPHIDPSHALHTLLSMQVILLEGS